MQDLFSETLQEPVTFETILKRMKCYQQHKNKNHNKYVLNIGITATGDSYTIQWSNGDCQCYRQLDKMLKELNRVIPC